MAVYKNGELYKGNKNAPDGVREHVLSGAKINESITDYIAQNAHYASVINAIISIINMDDMYSDNKVRMISAILEGVE